MTIDEAIAREKELTDHCKKMLEGIEKDRQGSYDCGYDVGYNKAIDDCIEIVKFHRDSWDGIEWAIRDIEKLKAGDRE